MLWLLPGVEYLVGVRPADPTRAALPLGLAAGIRMTLERLLAARQEDAVVFVRVHDFVVVVVRGLFAQEGALAEDLVL